MGKQKRNPVGCILPIVIVLGVVAAIFFQWREEIVYWATGEDILADLQATVVDPTPTLLPPEVTLPPGVTPSATTAAPAPNTDAPQVTAEDGFPAAAREHVVKYTVQPGDALFVIAERFQLNPNTIFWANLNTLEDNVHLLYVGVELYILPTDGVYHTATGTETIADIAAQYGVQPGDILYSDYNSLAEETGDYIPMKGLKIVVPGGQRTFISWQAPIRTGTESGGANPEGSIHPGSCQQVYTGTGGLGEYINPLGQIPYRITSTFASFHPGVDLATDRGTPIYAAETGVVVFAGWHHDGYGEMVIVDHGAGWTTYYAHMSTRFVDCGQQVSKGTLLGEMGMTGNATGIHLHFEIRENDIPLNPYNFLELVDVRTGS